MRGGARRGCRVQCRESIVAAGRSRRGYVGVSDSSRPDATRTPCRERFIIPVPDPAEPRAR